MNIDTMRFIDRFVGVPLCWMFSIIDRLNIFKYFSKDKPVKKILFVEISEMGSTVIAYSALRKTIREFPGAEVFFVIFERNKRGVELSELLDDRHILTIRDTSLIYLVMDTLKFLIRCRRERIDAVLDLELFSRFTALLSYLTGARNRVGFSKYTNEGPYRGSLLTRPVFYNPYQHMAKNFVALVHALQEPKSTDGVYVKRFISDSEIVPLRKNISAERKDAIKQFLIDENPKTKEAESFILLNPNAGDLLPIRAWPIEKYTQLIQDLIDKTAHHIVITGYGKSAGVDAKYILDRVESDRLTDITNKTSFDQLIDLFYVSDLLITNDSGPAHFASIAPIKVLTFFGPETPLLYGPLTDKAINITSNFSCSPCLSAYNHRTTWCKNNKCLKVVPVSRVFNAAMNLLQK